jgi:hypothetical protein
VRKIAHPAPIGAHRVAPIFPVLRLTERKVNNMNIEKLRVKTDAVIPLMAALPYGIALEPNADVEITYNPESQLTLFAGRNFSTCRYDESVGLLQSKSDTQKDD